MHRSLAFAVTLTLPITAASAQDLEPIENYSLHLGPVSGSVYVDKAGSEQRLVATLSSGPDATPVRFVTTLAAGQSAMISVPRGPGERAAEVTFTRRDDHVVVEDSDPVVGSIR